MRPQANKSELTAITRKRLSYPMATLLNSGVLAGKMVLDYGCGKGDDVARLLEAGINAKGFDPFWRDYMPVGLFDVVTMIYVVNTLELWDDKRLVIQMAKQKLTDNGILYVAIRTDRRNLKGRTAKGTWQDYSNAFMVAQGFGLAHRKPNVCEIWYDGINGA